MKKIAATLCSLGLTALAGTAQAAPVQYQFTAQHTGETNAANVQVAADTFLFANGTPLTFNFSYDADTPVTTSNFPGGPGLAGFGYLSYYAGSLSALSGSVAGYSFSAATGSTNVANSNPGDSTVYDGVFHVAGNINGDPVGTGFSGFSIGGFTLTGVNQYSVGPNSYLPDQSLPDLLINGPFNTGLSLIFEGSGGEQRIVQFWAGQVAPVPVPAAFWLFGSALAGLGVARRRRAV